MNRVTLSLMAAAALLAVSAKAHATDVLSQDVNAQTLTVTASDGTVQTLEIDAKSDLRGICEPGGCNIALASGQSVDAKEGDIVLIDENGEISIHED